MNKSQQQPHDASKRSIIYRWRYLIGYTCLAAVFAFSLVFLSQHTPGGLLESEMQSVIASENLLADPLSQNIINAPYKLLQSAAISLFGLNIFTIKLPSVIIAFLSGFAIIFLLRRWYRPNIAFLAAAIALTSSMFLFAAQDGTPAIMYIFWSSTILLLGSLLTNLQVRARLVLFILFMIALGLSLYTPFMIYITLALLFAGILHPHLRFAATSFRISHAIIGFAAFLIITTPLVVSSVLDYNTIGALLFQGNLSEFNFFENIRLALSSFTAFNINLNNPTLTPVLSLASIALILIGLADSLKERYTAKNYILAIWIIFAIFVIALAPDKISIVFVPLALLIASGIEFVLGKWYSLFPENPYARIGGLIPISFFALLSIVTSIEYFAYGYYYTPQVAHHFSRDLALIKPHLNPDSIIVAPTDSTEYHFFSTLTDHHGGHVTDHIPDHIPTNLIVLRSALDPEVDNPHLLTKIVTSRHTDRSNRLHIYQNRPDAVQYIHHNNEE